MTLSGPLPAEPLPAATASPSQSRFTALSGPLPAEPLPAEPPGTAEIPAAPRNLTAEPPRGTSPRNLARSRGTSRQRGNPRGTAEPPPNGVVAAVPRCRPPAAPALPPRSHGRAMPSAHPPTFRLAAIGWPPAGGCLPLTGRATGRPLGSRRRGVPPGLRAAASPPRSPETPAGSDRRSGSDRSSARRHRLVCRADAVPEAPRRSAAAKALHQPRRQRHLPMPRRDTSSPDADTATRLLHWNRVRRCFAYSMTLHA